MNDFSFLFSFPIDVSGFETKGRGPSPGLGAYSSNDYHQWMARAPSTSAIYESVRKSGTRNQLERPSSALASGLSNTSLSKIAHSAESLLETIRLVRVLFIPLPSPLGI